MAPTFLVSGDLFNSIHKLFDYVLIDICGDSLSTSDMQYGSKNNHSTTMCTVILKEVIHHYINGNSNVYCCLLDASRAFDKINYGKLFSTLLAICKYSNVRVSYFIDIF